MSDEPVAAVTLSAHSTVLPPLLQLRAACTLESVLESKCVATATACTCLYTGHDPWIIRLS
jgi:hypothetical protein